MTAVPDVAIDAAEPIESPVLEVVPLGMRWPTIDPFLFCVNHDDAYPAGDDAMAPAVPIDDRDLGQDFSAVDGWSMYHGLTVPGFPGHPHRGFETVTYVRQGLIDHSTRSAPPPGSAGATCSGSPPGRASSTPRCSRCSTATAATRWSCSRSG